MSPRHQDYTQISVLRNQEIRRHVPFLNWKPHTKYMGPDPHTKSMTHTICVKCHTKCMGVTQNVWAPYLTMRHFLLESLYGRRPIVSLFLFAIFLMTEIRVYPGTTPESDKRLHSPLRTTALECPGTEYRPSRARWGAEADHFKYLSVLYLISSATLVPF